MGKFKVGDKVRRVDASPWPHQFGEVGGEYTVLDIDGAGNLIIFEGCKGASAKAFELVPEWQPKVGDRVRMKHEVDGYKTDCAATVVYDDGTTSKPFVIKFDERQSFGHTAWNNAPDGFGYWVTADDIEPLPVAAEAQPAVWVPKVGDRVRVTYGGNWAGEGDVYALSPGHVYVTMLTGANKGHRGGFVIGKEVEPLPVAAALTIEAGKFYKTRDGRKVGPLVFVGDYWTNTNDHGNYNPGHYTSDGVSAFLGKLPREESRLPFDLIAEWVDEPAVAPVAVANDNAAPAKFKVGDRVRHVGIQRCSNGEITVVLPWGRYRVNWHNDLGICVDPAEKLELVTQPTAIVALIENGQPKPAYVPVVHASEAAAAKEATRLASKHKGQEFGVYVLSSTAKEEKPALTYKHEWQRLAAKGEKINAIKELRSITGFGLKAAKDAVEYWLAHDEPYARIAA